MSDTPKFTVIDRRKMKAEQEQAEEHQAPVEQPAAPAPTPVESIDSEERPGPRLVVNEPRAEEPAESIDEAAAAGLPPAPSAEEAAEQKKSYDAASERLEDLIRAQNPGADTPPPVAFEHLVQQLYLSAMIQMGAGTQDGQRPRVDIVGARQSIDLLGLLAEKTQGNLSAVESRTLEAVLFETRMAFV